MKPYGIKHKKCGPCVCEMCGPDKKKAVKRRERQKTKTDIKKALEEK